MTGQTQITSTSWASLSHTTGIPSDAWTSVAHLRSTAGCKLHGQCLRRTPAKRQVYFLAPGRKRLLPSGEFISPLPCMCLASIFTAYPLVAEPFRYEPRGLFLDPPTVGMSNGLWKISLPSHYALDGDEYETEFETLDEVR